MKRLVFLMILIIPIIACKKIDKLTHFYMNYETNINIDKANVFGTPFDVRSPLIATHSDSIFLSAHTNTDQVTQIILKQISMLVLPSDSIPDDYIQSIGIYLLDEGGKDKLVAWNYHISGGMHTAFSFEYTKDDLSDYLKKPQIQYRIHGELTNTKVYDAQLKFDSQYFTTSVIPK
ncbi:MAG: hypothetical protein Q8O72_11095 [Bacteroidales bacterium]|nr:hypothetical protein [Bacteroidales bacterium]